MSRFLFRFFVITITILTANLLTSAIGDYLTTYRNHVKPFTFTLIGMSVIVVIFYPLFSWLEIWVKKISSVFIRKSRNVGGKYLGLTAAFLSAMIVIFYFYLKMWYSIDLFRLIISGNILNYF